MIKFLIGIIPNSLKRKIYYWFLPFFKEKNRMDSESMPRYSLRPEMLEHARLLVNRDELLKLLPKHGIVAELGVDEGHFSEHILSITEPQKLHLVDIWADGRYNKSKQKAVTQKFANEINSGKVQIDIGLSTEAVHRIPDNYFDWIYIDTNHTYQTTIQELEAYQSKMKPEGIIAGHDFIIGNWNGIFKYGVIEAVYEFCTKYNWEFLYLTMEIDNHPSFAIRKIF